MNMAEYWRKAKGDIDVAIAESVQDLLLRWVNNPQCDDDIPEHFARAVELSLDGGKRLRGVLTCLVCEALGGKRSDALSRAVAIEYIQAATLVIDDIIDGDRLRRGQPAIWTLEGVEKEGAFLIGEVLHTFGVATLSDLSHEDAKSVTWAICKTATGVLREYSGAPTSRFALSELMHLKTGALFGAAAQLGALAAGSGEFMERAYRYGSLCGEAFQVADDERDEPEPISSLVREEVGGLIKQQLAEAAQDSGFPRNKYTEMFWHFPPFVVEMMLREAK